VAFRDQLKDDVITYGGDYRPDLTKRVTHLIALAPEGRKYQYAELWRVRVVSFRWLEDCLARGMVLDEEPYDITVSNSYNPR
jgi:DNA replication regulator DPB11